MLGVDLAEHGPAGGKKKGGEKGRSTALGGDVAVRGWVWSSNFEKKDWCWGGFGHGGGHGGGRRGGVMYHCMGY